MAPRLRPRRLVWLWPPPTQNGPWCPQSAVLSCVAAASEVGTNPWLIAVLVAGARKRDEFFDYLREPCLLLPRLQTDDPAALRPTSANVKLA
jgi:hypothetical protein